MMLGGGSKKVAKSEPLPASDDQLARAARDDERMRTQERARYGSSGANLTRKTRPSLANGGGLYSKGRLG